MRDLRLGKTKKTDTINIVQECYFISRGPRLSNGSIFRFTLQAKSNKGPLPTIQLYKTILTALQLGRRKINLDVLQLIVNEKVSVRKVLGISLCDNLKWGQNTKEIVDKACKRLYLLRASKRACVPPDHPITIYCALVRSVLEYACQVWSCSLQSHLKQRVERV